MASVQQETSQLPLPISKVLHILFSTCASFLTNIAAEAQYLIALLFQLTVDLFRGLISKETHAVTVRAAKGRLYQLFGTLLSLLLLFIDFRHRPKFGQPQS